MRVKFPLVSVSRQQATLDKMTRIVSEVPITIKYQGEEIAADAMSLHCPISSFPITMPKDSIVEVHDGTLCEYRDRVYSHEIPRGFEADTIITYVRPISLTGTKRVTYQFPIKFSDKVQTT